MPALKLVQTTVAVLAASALLAAPARAQEPEPTARDLTADTAPAKLDRSTNVLIPDDATKAEIRKLRKQAVKQAVKEDRREDHSRAATVLRVAASKAGAPYAYGGAGPSVFDCSGFTRWVYAHVGRSLPHSSAGQVGYTTRVSNPQPGDLAFFYGSGGVYHVGIYAGNHSVWHAPYPGRGVSREQIWTSAVFYGRVK